MTAILERVIQHFGSQAALAAALDKTPMAVSHWKKRGIPVLAAIQIEQVTCGVLRRCDVRPDIFPPSDTQDRAA